MSIRTYGQVITSRLLARRRVKLHNSRPLISFSFDDFPRSALLNGGAILQGHGFVATYYASLGLMSRQIQTGIMFSRDDLDELLAAGHELGSHTFAHCHSWETSPAAFERSIIENASALEKLVPSAKFRTFSYPKSYPRPGTKRRTGRYFLCARGGGQVCNSGVADLNCLNSFFIDQRNREDFDVIKQVIDANCAVGGWLIFSTHDVADHPTPYGCATGLFERVVRVTAESGARIVPVAEGARLVCNLPTPLETDRKRPQSA